MTGVAFQLIDPPLQRGKELAARLNDMRVLVMEDEYFIALDVEHACQEHGAAEVRIARTLKEVGQAGPLARFDAVILDVMLAGESTLDFAASLERQGIPFVFATGYGPSEPIFEAFPDVTVVGKPYSAFALVSAIVEARDRLARAG